MTPRPPRRADAWLLGATALWGVSFVVVKTALEHSTPLAFLAVRFTLAALLLAPFIPLNPPPSRRELVGGVLLGALLSVGFAAQTIGLLYTTPSRSAFITASSSVLVPVVAFAVLREWPRWLTVGALGLAGLGIYLLSAPDAGGLNRGDLWTLLCSVSFAGQLVAVAELARRYEARRLVWLQIAATALGAALAAAVLEEVRIAWSAAFGGALAYVVLIATVFCLLAQMRAQREMSAARAALIFCFEPVFAALTSWLWLGERLLAMQWLGGGLIVLGMIVSDLPVARREAVVG